VTKRNSSPGRARRKPLKPLRGESRVTSGVLVVTTVCLLPMHTGCGCIGHPAFPAPSVFRGTRLWQTSGSWRREKADLYPFSGLTGEARLGTPGETSPARIALISRCQIPLLVTGY
jgi:hypothetical protein